MAKAFKGAMFEKMPVERLPRNTFDLSHRRLTTMEMGEIIPVLLLPVNPADRIKCAVSDFCRMMPMYAPIMDELEVCFYAFYERENQLWRRFDDFFRGGDDGQTDYSKPSCGEQVFQSGNVIYMDTFYRIMTQEDIYIDWDTGYADVYKPTLPDTQGQLGLLMAPGSLYDHFGLPTIELDKYYDEGAGTSDNIDWSGFHYNFIHSEMEPWDMAPFKMYQDIFNEYFRDEFISEKVEIFRDFDGDMLENVVTSDGVYVKEEITPRMLQELFKKRNRAWEKDRFTSALQEPISIPEVLMPSNVEVDIVSTTDTGDLSLWTKPTLPSSFIGTNLKGDLTAGKIALGSDMSQPDWIQFDDFSGSTIQADYSEIASKLKARVSQTTATINELRSRVALLEFYEQQARGGNRIKESIMINFNSVVPDYRLDRPQYLGGFKHVMSISQVLQTSSSVGNENDSNYQPLGQLAGQGLSGQSGFLFNEYFPEAGYIMVVANIRPRSSYSQGMPKVLQRFHRLDYYWHKLANIGDEPIFNKEIFCPQDAFVNENNPNLKNDVFGYQTRYSEYKYIGNSIHGDFKTSLKDWHLSRFFDETPLLNQDFIEIQPKSQGLNRIFNYGEDDYGHFLLQLQFNLHAERVMEIYSVPRFA